MKAPAPSSRRKLSLLILEDCADDAELIVRQLQTAGFEPEWQRVETEHALRAALNEKIDLIISDYSLPQYDGLRAAELVRDSKLDIPFILVTGTLGEEFVVECIRRGATDYLLKDNLIRLGPAVANAIAARKLRQQRLLSEQDKKRVEDLHRERAEVRAATLTSLAKLCASQRSDEIGALNEITAATARALEVERASVWQLNAAHSQIVCKTLFEMTGERHSAGMQLEAVDFPGYFEALAHCEVIAADNARQDARTREFTASYLDPHEITSMLDAPFRLDGALAGVLCLEHVGPPRVWTHGEHGFAVSVASLISLLLEQQARVRSEARLRTILENEPECVMVVAHGGTLLDMNAAGLRMVEARLDEVLGRRLFDLIHPEDQAACLALHQRVCEGRTGVLQFRVTGLQGTQRWLETHSVPLRSSDDSVISVLSVARDITDRKRDERRLRAFAQLGRRLGASSTVADAAHIIAEAADELAAWDACWLHLYDAAQHRSQSVLNIDTVDGIRQEVPPAYTNTPPSPFTESVVREGSRLILRQGNSDELERLAPFGEKTRKSASIMATPVRHAGKVIAVFSIQSYTPNAFDNEDLKAIEALADHCGGTLARIRAYEAQHESEERFRLLSKATNDAIWDWDLATNTLWWNEGFETLFGFRRDEVEPTIDSWYNRVHPDEREPVIADVHRAIDGGAASWSGEYRFRRKDGTFAYVLDRGHVIRDAQGKPVRIIGGMTDLTTRKQAEEKLQEQAALLDKAQDAILVRDLDHRILYWNKSAERLYGWTASEVMGKSVKNLLYRNTATFDTITTMALEKGEWVGEIEQFTKEGNKLIIEGRWTLVRDNAGQPKSILAINTDITEKKRLEAQFLRTQRMESVGTLAGGIAHDLNNILAPILMSINLLQSKVQDEESRSLLAMLQSCAQRGADLVRQVLTFARGVDGQRLVVNLAHLTRDIKKIIHETFPKKIEFSLNTSTDLWPVMGDPTQLHQVLMNLCVNARDAMPDGGRLTLAVENTVLDEVYAGMNPDSKPGPYVMIVVADTGTGIPPGIRDKIFEPFFTTKELGHGTGLGLSTVAAIVKSHGGFINLYSEPGKGTRFKVYLPTETTTTSAEKVAVQKTGLPRGNGELVLVVDDEASVREVTKKTLERFGYQVILAVHGAEAVSHYVQHREKIAVVLTDMAMPIMDGPATIAALKALDPNVRIIGSSGLSDNAMIARVANNGVRHFVPKPYTADTLLRTIQAELNGAENP
jgi:PAS domain S-box-containing protein